MNLPSDGDFLPVPRQRPGSLWQAVGRPTLRESKRDVNISVNRVESGTSNPRTVRSDDGFLLEGDRFLIFRCALVCTKAEELHVP